jgi:hypothetical protein
LIYKGPKGFIATVTFVVKSSGSIPISFSSASVLANDGKGSEILTNAGSALLDVPGTERDTPPPPAVTPIPAPQPKPPVISPAQTTQNQTLRPLSPSTTKISKGVPTAPIISSPTHPVQDQWYRSRTAIFRWDVPEDVTAMRLLYGTRENINPTVYYASPIEEKILEDVADGTYWFHARFKNAHGWGETAHFKFNVDKTKPDELTILHVNSDEFNFAKKEKSTGDNLVSTAKFSFDKENSRWALTLDNQGENTIFQHMPVVFYAVDQLSGIGHFDVKIDDGSWKRINLNETYTDEVTHAIPGTHTLYVRAVDNAGNYLEKTSSYYVKPNVFRFFPDLPPWVAYIEFKKLFFYLLIVFTLIFVLILHRTSTIKPRHYAIPIILLINILTVLLRLLCSKSGNCARFVLNAHRKRRAKKRLREESHEGLIESKQKKDIQ